MALDEPAQLPTLQQQLIQAAQTWALRQRFNPERAAELRRAAILGNHAAYLEQIPAYQRLAREEGLSALDDIEPIKRHLMVPDDLFKSYNPRWLDEQDFTRMTRWLAEVYHQRIEVDMAGVATIDEWLDRLGRVGVRPVYSSGTSGTFSFIPRDERTLSLLKMANTSYLLPLLLAKVGAAWQRFLVQASARLLSPAAFSRLATGRGVPDFDGVFLDFRSGKTGMQAIGQELAPIFRRHYFLYDYDLTATILRLLTRGPRTAEDQALLENVQAQIVGQREQNFARLLAGIRTSLAAGQKIFIFGAPYQFKSLCDYMAAENKQVSLKPGSLVLFGGGWKSFSGEKVSREVLVAGIAENFGLPPEHILEGYSMTEINVFMLRCDAGRFHIPPIVEPVMFDEELAPVEGRDVRGIFGFLDPLALAYPGFVISGDTVRLVNDGCPCGLVGPAVTEIGRAVNREIKGCGGVMASMAA